jgi:molybdate transport system permease protein
MVLPPTVAGFFLLLIFSLRRPVGEFLYATFSIKVVQSWLGCIVAASVIAFPLMYRNARAAFEQVDIELIYAGRTLGMSERRIFWRVVLPSAGPGVVSGTILTFARALAGKTGTISQRIAMVIQNGDYATAGVWVAVILIISFAIVFLMNIFADSRLKNVKKW